MSVNNARFIKYGGLLRMLPHWHLFKEKFPCFPLRHGPCSWTRVTGRVGLHHNQRGVCEVERSCTIPFGGVIQTGPITANEVCGLMRDRSERPQCCLGVDAGAFEGPLRSACRTSIRVWIYHRAIVVISGRVTTESRDKP